MAKRGGGKFESKKDPPPVFKGGTQAATPAEGPWWFDLVGDQKDRLASTLFGYMMDLRRRSSSRHLGDLEHLRMYGQPYSSPYIGSDSYARAAAGSPFGNASRVTISLCQAIIDTITSKLFRNQPRVFFVTEGGDYDSQELAKRLQSFNDGCYYETNAYNLAKRAWVDAAVFGTGFLHVFENDDGRVDVERCFPYEILVDDADGLYGYPRNLYRIKYVDKHVLKQRFPKFSQLIDLAQGLREQTERSMPTAGKTNRVTVVEAWHLASGPNSEDGRHTIAISNAVLTDEEWTRPGFPFAVMRYNPKQCGYFGQGVPEMIASLQTEMNTCLKKIQICMHFLAVPHWLKPTGSNIGFGAFNNQIGSVINYTGVPPELKIWPSVPSEYFRHVDWLYEKGFEVAGVSQLSAQSKIPGYGTMSGSALREYSDVESDRFDSIDSDTQQFHIDLSKLMLEEAEAIAAKNDGNYEVTFVHRSNTGKPRRLERIDWNEVDLGEAKYQIRIQPVSKLPRTVAALTQTGQELVQSGVLPVDMFKDMLQMPDLDAELDIERAGRDLVHKIVAKILKKGQAGYQPPDSYMDLAYAMKYGTLLLNRAIADEMDPDHIEVLRTWISEVDDIQASAQQAIQTPAPMQGGTPPPQPLAPATAPGAVS